MEINVSPEVDVQKIKEILAEIETDAMGGWLKLPLEMDAEELRRIKMAARKIQDESEVLVCIGIGGSYLGHRAIIEAVEPRDGAKIVYAGNSLSRRELGRALMEVEEKDFSVNVISKSGTTLEPAVAFRAFYDKLVERYGVEEAHKRIYATTDATQGTLHDEAVANGYERFVVPDNIGGRYSVLTAVGLLPLAVAGVDIDGLIAGASEEALKVLRGEPKELSEVKYAVMRNILREKGYDMEIFATFEPCMRYFNEWLKQLFGESEGKNGQGVWPASVVYSTDLHSLGQFIQEGRRNVWETIVDVPTDEQNQLVEEAVQKAHVAGGIPVLVIRGGALDAKGMGRLVYFFETACAISAKLMGVNPFDQPGVEAYKNELKRLREQSQI